MTYAELLEASYEDTAKSVFQAPVNETFASLNKFMNESFSMLLDEANFDVVFGINDLVFTESEDEGKKLDVKGTMAKAGKAVKEFINKLITKVSEFIKAIPVVLSRVIAKAKLTIGKFGNESLRKTIETYPDAVASEDIKIKVSAGKISKAYDLLEKAIANTKNVNLQTVAFEDIRELQDKKAEITRVITAFEKPVKESDDMWKDYTIKAGANIKNEYNSSLAPTVKEASEIVSKLSTLSKDSMDWAKRAKVALEKIIADVDNENSDEEKKFAASGIKTVGAIISEIIKATKLGFNYTIDVLSVINKNANIMAHAAVSEGKKVNKVVKSEENKAEDAE